MTEVLLIAAWGLVVLAAIDGWGGLAVRLAPTIPIDAGLRLAWGMAVLLAIGGVLTALSLATGPVVTIVVVVGALLALPHWRRAAGWRVVGPMGCAVGLILVLHYLGQVAGVQAVCADDHAAYWGFVKRQLALGAVDEPFSLRRLAGHGGQMFLQSLVVAQGGLENAFLVERGIAPIIIYLLLRGAMPERGPAVPAFVLTMTMVTLQYEFNSQSLFTGVVLFLGLARTLVALDAPLRTRFGELILVGLLVAGLSALRVMFLVGAALTVAMWGLSAWRGLRTLPALSWRAATLLCGSLVFFIPWMVGLWRSSGTPLFPLFAGNGGVGVDNFYASGTAFNDLALTYATTPHGIFLCIPVLAFWRPTRERRVLVISHIAALLLIALFSLSFPDADSWDLARYMWPMVVTPVLLTAIIGARAAQLAHAGRPVLAALVVGCFTISGFKLNHDMTQFARAIERNGDAEEVRLTELHQRLQDLMPVGETLLVATDHPYLVDYRRDRTWNIDIPGAASPASGMPFFHGPDAVQDYLVANGVHYVLFVDGMQANPCMFNRTWYTSPEMKLTPALWQLQARYILDFLDNMSRLAVRDTVLGHEDDHILLRLDNR